MATINDIYCLERGAYAPHDYQYLQIGHCHDVAEDEIEDILIHPVEDRPGKDESSTLMHKFLQRQNGLNHQ